MQKTAFATPIWMRRKMKHHKPSSGLSLWSLLYLGLIFFVIGVIAVMHRLPSHDNISVDQAKIINILLSSAGGPPLQHAQVPLAEPSDPAPIPIAESGQAISKAKQLRGAVSAHSIASIDVTAELDKHSGPAKLGLDTALLVMCSNRPDYLRKSLSYVLKYHPLTAVPIVISQDNDLETVNKVVTDFIQQMAAKSSAVSVTHLHHAQQGHYENGYFALADHFKWALQQVFDVSSIKRVIILEEDLQIAEDFFEYFAATAPLLDNDPDLMAVSAWNDNGFASLVSDPSTLYRSDFFPGLGWMMTKAIWQELEPKWPKAYWDDWLREPAQRKGRQFIRPEICRTLHFGRRGVSNAQYSEYLSSIQLNTQYTTFTAIDLSYLLQPAWDTTFLSAVRSAQEVNIRELEHLMPNQLEEGRELKVRYNGLEGYGYDSFTRVAEQARVMDNIKAGVPRTAYKGIVSFRKVGTKVHLVPKSFT